ncbi:unnamed protein product [Urochloa humidicola]
MDMAPLCTPLWISTVRRTVQHPRGDATGVASHRAPGGRLSAAWRNPGRRAVPQSSARATLPDLWCAPESRSSCGQHADLARAAAGGKAHARGATTRGGEEGDGAAVDAGSSARPWGGAAARAYPLGRGAMEPSSARGGGHQDAAPRSDRW